MTIISANTDINTISEKQVLEIVADKKETIFWDFKEYLFPSNQLSEKDKNDYIFSVRKCMASFANAYGGFIFFGIVDSSAASTTGVSIRDVGLTNNDDAELAGRIQKKYLEGKCDPEVIRFECKVLLVEGQQIVILKIHSNPDIVYGIRKNPPDPLFFYTRGAQQCVPMSYQSIWEKISRTQKAITRRCILREVHKTIVMLKLAKLQLEEGKEAIFPISMSVFLSANLPTIEQFEGSAITERIVGLEHSLVSVNYYIAQSLLSR